MLGLWLILSSCLKEEKLKREYAGFTPRAAADGWETSTAFAENVNEALLEEAYALIYNEERFPMARSLLVIRNGKLIAEAYPNDEADFHRLNNIQSCTKSFTSLAVGVAINQGLITDLNEKLFAIYPQHFDNDIGKKQISLRHALRMQTGLEFDNGEHTLELYQTEVIIRAKV